MRALPAFALALLLAAPAARAWDSTCYEYPDTSLEADAYPAAGATYCDPDAGPNAARNRWVGGVDEHRRIFEETRREAGLPDSVSNALHLTVFTSATPVTVKDHEAPSLIPVPFDEAVREQERTFTLGELAQLPDFAYALWDWAEGDETCPLAGDAEDAVACHDFASHMGPVNSNHFLPQAARFYARYHAQALLRAAECKAAADRLGDARGRFSAYAEACEDEALALEAVGQHFLEDAWAEGHMWERWGGPDLSDFPAGPDQRTRAVMVALVSGLVHGARGVLQKLPDWTTFDVDDALNAPYPTVNWVANGVMNPGVGDDYLPELPPWNGANRFQVQARALLSCATSGLREVYEAAGEQHGPEAPAAAGLTKVDPLSDACFGQRATNEAMLEGAAIQLRLAGVQLDLPLDARVATFLVPKVSGAAGEVDIPAPLENRYRLEAARAASLIRLYAKRSPHGTEVASGALGPLLGAKPNGAYADRPLLASYVEPALPWPATPDPSPDSAARALALARTFHLAHAADWCLRTTADDLDAMKAHADDPALDPTSRAAACDACAEIVSRHLRLGTPDIWDSSQEPLCHYLADAPALVYEPPVGGLDAVGEARSWCGCD